MDLTTDNSSIQGINISKIYRILSSKLKIKVLDSVSFNFHPGDIVLLTGKNGSGKSTLLRMIAGITKPSKGQIKTCGKIGYYPQNPQFNKGVSVLDFTNYIGSLKSSKYITPEGKIWLDKFGITDKWKKMDLLVLSEGMRRRVALAIAFLGNPDILLLDEPLENLDVDIKEELIKILDNELQNKKTIIIASHTKESFTRLNPRELNIEKGIQ